MSYSYVILFTMGGFSQPTDDEDDGDGDDDYDDDDSVSRDKAVLREVPSSVSEAAKKRLLALLKPLQSELQNDKNASKGTKVLVKCASSR
eukprot:jgi/Bigna1/147534/aug1.190_g22242